MANPLVELQALGQSIWYDNIRRSMITSGELKGMIENDGLLGMTSNPAIFEKALSSGTDYEPTIRAGILSGTYGGNNAQSIYEQFAIEDIRLACDLMRPVYDKTSGKDGYVSLEVSPYLANHTGGTIAEADRLHREVARDNVMIKIPATSEGIPAISRTIASGISVNVTLLFAVDMYVKAAEAFMEGLEKRLATGKDISNISSVASFFVSRIDSLVDEKLTKLLESTRDADKKAKIESLFGQVAIANAQVAYAKYEELYSSDRWKKLAAAGAKPQRLLWASTSTKNPKYTKTIYIDRLIAPDTVNTVPAETYAEYRERGTLPTSMTVSWDRTLATAKTTMKNLADVGVSMKEVTDALQIDGVKKFAEAFDKLLGAVETKRREVLGPRIAGQSAFFAGMAGEIHTTMQKWKNEGLSRRIWDGDPKVWTNSNEDRWLGWLGIAHQQESNLDLPYAVMTELHDEGITHVVVLGMGGSSLCPEVLAKTFENTNGSPTLLVLDSTDPAQVATLEKKLDLTKTVFFVSSKSGSTIEPNSFKQYFFEKVKQAVGPDRVGDHFIAITDPKTKMEQVAKADRFRHILYGDPTIGGRYSALSHFGMGPGAAMGMETIDFILRTETMIATCSAGVPADMNPAVALGVAMGKLAQGGRDKLTIVCSPGIASLGAWLEQLIAESTGKQGKGIVPVADERLGEPAVYGNDRFFAYIRLANAASAEQDKGIDALEKAGHPVCRITLNDIKDLGQEFFRWEFATAVTGAVMRINPFDQPDVESAKIAARKLTADYETSGKLPDEKPILIDGKFKLFADSKNADSIGSKAKSKTSAADWIAAHLHRIGPGDYFAINAYVEMCDANDKHLQAIRHAVRDSKRVATTVGYGPRFLHSTGQLHKGGPNSGIFLQITADDAADLPIPGQKFTFGLLKRFQALGDYAVLVDRSRRILRVHLGSDVEGGLKALSDAVAAAVR